MSVIQSLEVGWYRIPLAVPLTDSTHGVMTAFEVITASVTDADGQTGVGYTYTTGHNGGAVADILRREVSEIVVGHDADLIPKLWERVWWGLHYGGRGGADRARAVSVRHCAVGPEGKAGGPSALERTWWL
jgi:L-alanine-DL-glutamate epimerase-like enolase superfamily enzyme